MNLQHSKLSPLIAVTMGDPAGIGPEIAAKAISKNNTLNDFGIFIIGDNSVMEQALKITGLSMHLHSMASIEDFKKNYINILDQQQIVPGDFAIGTENAKCGKASYNYILKAISLAKQGLIDAVVTCPINKAALKKAGINYPGHTEIFAHETDTENYSMMFMLDNVCVVHVTTHCSLMEAIKLITKEKVAKNIYLLNKTLKSLGIENPRIAVGGLNPHAGEGGLFGNEEILRISPAVIEMQKQGIDVTGPLPADTVFMRAFRGEFDGIVSMLHDHGFVALKSRNFERCVNITVGLPIIRTSVGHGTAFDIAGTGKASASNLFEAVLTAYRMCKKSFSSLL